MTIPAVTQPPAASSSAPNRAAWRRDCPTASLPEVHASVRLPAVASRWRMLLAFTGPGLIVSVGYMDPGNWATGLAGGARFGYTLLSVILLSNIMAMLLQHLALKLGVVTGRDLAQACRDHFSPGVGIVLWLICELAIAACDLAEVIGSAIALQLLFGLPLVAGVCLTALDVLVVLALQHRGFRAVEAMVGGLVALIGMCFAYELIIAHPALDQALGGLLPRPEILQNPGMLLVAVGILGATVMPHNLYLHSSIVQTRAYPRDEAGKARAIRYATLDSTLALFFAFFINAAILMLAAAVFHTPAHTAPDAADVGIQDAFQLLTPALGVTLASTVFAIALLCSGQSSTFTGTLAGQVVMEGFLHLRMKPWARRLLTRSIAIVPAVLVAARSGEAGVDNLLILSQVILALQLPFAVIPLVWFTSSRAKMGRFANKPWLAASAWLVALAILGLNLVYLYTQLYTLLAPAPAAK